MYCCWMCLWKFQERKMTLKSTCTFLQSPLGLFLVEKAEPVWRNVVQISKSFYNSNVEMPTVQVWKPIFLYVFEELSEWLCFNVFAMIRTCTYLYSSNYSFPTCEKFKSMSKCLSILFVEGEIWFSIKFVRFLCSCFSLSAFYS